MRSIFEQVDEFIEGVFDGSIVFLTSDLFKTPSIEKQNKYGFGHELEKKLHESKRRIVEELIPKYLTSTDDEEKENTAFEIFNAVTHNRSIGTIYNNPNTSKELNWYRIQNSRLNEDNKQLREDVKNLTEKIMALANIKDEKVGIV